MEIETDEYDQEFIIILAGTLLIIYLTVFSF